MIVRRVCACVCCVSCPPPTDFDETISLFHPSCAPLVPWLVGISRKFTIVPATSFPLPLSPSITHSALQVVFCLFVPSCDCPMVDSQDPTTSLGCRIGYSGCTRFALQRMESTLLSLMIPFTAKKGWKTLKGNALVEPSLWDTTLMVTSPEPTMGSPTSLWLIVD